MSKKSQMKWLERSLMELSCCYCLCLTEKDFQKTLKRLKVSKNDRPKFIIGGCSNATVHHFEDSDGAKTSVVCLNKNDSKKVTVTQIYGLLIHEAVHIWQVHRDSIGEDKPSSEFEAYAIQRIAQNLIYSWDEQTK